jgi:hypothetical protein
MVNLDLFVIEDAEDAIVAAHSDVYDFVIDGTECQNCGMMLGPLEEDFVSCVVVRADDSNSWVTCLDCAAPVLFPNEYGIRFEFFSTTELETFMLDEDDDDDLDLD